MLFKGQLYLSQIRGHKKHASWNQSFNTLHANALHNSACSTLLKNIFANKYRVTLRHHVAEPCTGSTCSPARWGQTGTLQCFQNPYHSHQRACNRNPDSRPSLTSHHRSQKWRRETHKNLYFFKRTPEVGLGNRMTNFTPVQTFTNFFTIKTFFLISQVIWKQRVCSGCAQTRGPDPSATFRLTNRNDSISMVSTRRV